MIVLILLVCITVNGVASFHRRWHKSTFLCWLSCRWTPNKNKQKKLKSWVRVAISPCTKLDHGSARRCCTSWHRGSARLGVFTMQQGLPGSETAFTMSCYTIVHHHSSSWSLVWHRSDAMPLPALITATVFKKYRFVLISMLWGAATINIFSGAWNSIPDVVFRFLQQFSTTPTK